MLPRQVCVREQLLGERIGERLLDREAPSANLGSVLLHRPEPAAQLEVERPLLDLVDHHRGRDRQPVRLRELLLQHGEHQASSASSSARLRLRSTRSPACSSRQTQNAISPASGGATTARTRNAQI